MRVFSFHFELMFLERTGIHHFCLWVHSKVDWILYLWFANQSERTKFLNSTSFTTFNN